MKNSVEFLAQVLDSVTDHIAVIDESGDIKFVNRAWQEFGYKNDCVISSSSWDCVNYLDECTRVAESGDQFGMDVLTGIQNVINGTQNKFELEYPCHSSDAQRWFVMRVLSFQLDDNRYFVISHQNITERKKAENAAYELARTDALTAIPNRRTLDEFLKTEWNRSLRHQSLLHLAIIDIDQFKLINDMYGHSVGDKCLQSVADILKRFANRADDICARYGGDEFVIVWTGITSKEARMLCQKIRKTVLKLDTTVDDYGVVRHVTVSIGLAGMVPAFNSVYTDLVLAADKKLYEAKTHGRNKVCAK
ncbi:sensor domain-containing diguanylate cyclase [Vibrio salinus]|uniref:sensor domain-containing diguanylate cyclase n=1 Tax=Vibrio salinus TaxID=2899784 RepID=UPI001E3E6160|nr:sensor domain-containing diguanylate cyclase [Vibrio salinus]MCE0495396.1 sensor domain-containing diguanylate cyclase [Vibrio salinus]